MHWALSILVFLLTVLAMEGAAWTAHKYLMHGPMWFLHRDHHVKTPGPMEKNDWFAVMFAAPAILLIWIGVNVWPPALPVGLGITAYGAIYFIFHDVIVHQRIRLDRLPDWPYLNRIIEAHRIHHHVRTKEGCVSFGFVITPSPAFLKAKLLKLKAAQHQGTSHEPPQGPAA